MTVFDFEFAARFIKFVFETALKKRLFLAPLSPNYVNHHSDGLTIFNGASRYLRIDICFDDASYFLFTEKKGGEK